MKILIVDDEKICRQLLSHALRNGGYETLEGESVPAALSLLRGGEAIGLVITDISRWSRI